MRIGRSRRTTRWLAGFAGLAVAAGGALLIARPAGAATTVTAELSLSGVVTTNSPVGGSVVGIHPGDSVDFKAAPAGISAQGLNKLGINVSGLLGALTGSLVGYQVVLNPGSLPGVTRPVTLGPCGGRSDLKINFPNTGTYNFTWSASSVTVVPVFGCSVNKLALNGNQLRSAGIAFNASNQWVGKVVVAVNPPAGGLSIQLPKVSAAPKVGGVQLPRVGLPGATLPTVPVTPPSLSPGLPSKAPPGGSSAGGINYRPPGGLIEDSVVPKGYGCCDQGSGHAPDAALNSVLLNGLRGGHGAVPGDLNGSTAPFSANKNGAPAAVPNRAGKSIDMASSKPPAGQMPVLLAILAIIALSLVTATYARQYLMRRSG